MWPQISIRLICAPALTKYSLAAAKSYGLDMSSLTTFIALEFEFAIILLFPRLSRFWVGQQGHSLDITTVSIEFPSFLQQTIDNNGRCQLVRWLKNAYRNLVVIWHTVEQYTVMDGVRDLFSLLFHLSLEALYALKMMVHIDWIIFPGHHEFSNELK